MSDPVILGGVIALLAVSLLKLGLSVSKRIKKSSCMSPLGVCKTKFGSSTSSSSDTVLDIAEGVAK